MKKLTPEQMEGQEIYNKIGLTLDVPFYRPLVDKWNACHNSSYNDLGKKRRERWAVWTQDEKEYFCEHLGQELIELGYEKDNSWVTRCYD